MEKGDPIKRSDKNFPTLIIRMSSSDGGFNTLSSTISKDASFIKEGDLVYWVQIEYSNSLFEEMKKIYDSPDFRMGWKGFITATLNPSLSSDGWSIKQKLQNDAAP